MKMKYRKKLKYIFFMLWMTILVSIFFPISVKAMEEEEKEQLGLVDNPYYAYYQGLSEEEEEKFEVIPRPYLLQKPLLIDKDGVHNLTGIEEAQVVVTNPLDISIVSLSSSWNEDWNKRPQEIIITPILMQDNSSVQTIKVNGESQEIRNGKAYYTIVKPGTYEIEVIDNHGNSREKTYVVNKIDIQKPEVEISSNSMDSSMREVIFTVNAKDEGESGLADYLFIHRSIDEEGTWFQVAGDTRYENTGELFWSEGFEKDSSGKQITASTRYVFPEDGSYTFYVKAVDMAGNESEVKSITVFLIKHHL